MHDPGRGADNYQTDSHGKSGLVESQPEHLADTAADDNDGDPAHPFTEPERVIERVVLTQIDGHDDPAV